jgi:hypothetical protein
MRSTSNLLLLTAALISLAPSADADNLVIWTPVKVSENSYKATMGFRLPAEWETSAGADLGLGIDARRRLAGRFPAGFALGQDQPR